MFYKTDEPLPLTIDPLKALVSPRPIGWISTISTDGICNLAPYSFFNLVSANPPMVMFSSGGRKDSLTNIEQTKMFVCNIASEALKAAVVLSSEPVDKSIDEFNLAGLTKAESQTIEVPRVAEAPAALECRLHDIIELPVSDNANTKNFMVLGFVSAVYINDAYICDGRVDITAYQPLARLGYRDYCHVSQVYRL